MDAQSHLVGIIHGHALIRHGKTVLSRHQIQGGDGGVIWCSAAGVGNGCPIGIAVGTVHQLQIVECVAVGEQVGIQLSSAPDEFELPYAIGVRPSIIDSPIVCLRKLVVTFGQRGRRHRSYIVMLDVNQGGVGNLGDLRRAGGLLKTDVTGGGHFFRVVDGSVRQLAVMVKDDKSGGERCIEHQLGGVTAYGLILYRVEFHIFGYEGDIDRDFGAEMRGAIAVLTYHHGEDATTVIVDLFHVKVQESGLMYPVFVEIHQIHARNLCQIGKEFL